ncbi:TetR/AcrR family transcriptional regulator [Telmatobacter bradus]|uniref:TetR/AcrR family transcriptional regulator n=1 Tax=Telmatobacter bradus TaxID=474953 RepID=UPI003B439FD1
MSAYSPKRRVGRPATEDRQQARTRILTSALDLFANRGIAGVPDSAIAQSAGVTPAMVRYYFADREALLDALFDEHIRTFVFTIWKIDELCWQRSLDVLSSLAHGIVEAAQTSPWLPNLWIREVVSETGLLRSRIIALLSELPMRRLAELVRREQQQGLVPSAIQPGLIFVSMIGLTMMPLAINLWRNLPDNERLGPSEIVHHALALLGYGLYGQPNATL